MTARQAMRTFAPLLLVWLALHAVLLAVLALVFGLAVVLRVLLGWLVHFGGFLLLAALGIGLVLGLRRPRDVSRAG